MKNRSILIIDDSESCIKAIMEGFNAFYEDDGYSFFTGKPVESVNEALAMINRFDCGVIFLDHYLTNNGEEGLIIAQEIENKGLLVLSTSSYVKNSRDCVKLYKEKGVFHFPGKSFVDIKNCLDGLCKCHLL